MWILANVKINLFREDKDWSPQKEGGKSMRSEKCQQMMKQWNWGRVALWGLCLVSGVAGTEARLMACQRVLEQTYWTAVTSSEEEVIDLFITVTFIQPTKGRVVLHHSMIQAFSRARSGRHSKIYLTVCIIHLNGGTAEKYCTDSKSLSVFE